MSVGSGDVSAVSGDMRDRSDEWWSDVSGSDCAVDRCAEERCACWE